MSDYEYSGIEDNYELMQLIDNCEGETTMEETNKIQELLKEVELYKQAIQDAKDALASAEYELDATLDAEFNGQ